MGWREIRRKKRADSTLTYQIATRTAKLFYSEYNPLSPPTPENKPHIFNYKTLYSKIIHLKSESIKPCDHLIMLSKFMAKNYREENIYMLPFTSEWEKWEPSAKLMRSIPKSVATL